MGSPPGNPHRLAFARELRQLHIACGKPSYETVRKLAEMAGTRMVKSTISEMMTGKRLPARDLVIAVVKALLQHHDPSVGIVGNDHDDVRIWREKWQAVQLGAANEIDSPPPASPVTPAAAARSHTTRRTAPSEPDDEPVVRPSRASLMSPQQRTFRESLDQALNALDSEGRVLGKAVHGCYAFYDVDGEPLYVGQTSESLGLRVRRHLTSQRSDAVAMSVLDVQEVAEVELWPVWSLQPTSRTDLRVARAELDRVERAVYQQAVGASRLGALLNEKIPPAVAPAPLPPSMRFTLIDDQTRAERARPDAHIARSAETLARLAAIVMERGHVSEGLRRALLVRSARLTDLAARQHAYVSGSPPPSADLVDLGGLIDVDVDALGD
jgi:hypothetical protein